MSVVVNNGYRLAPGTDPFTFITTLRTVMDPVRDRLDARALMERAVGAVDLADRKGEPRPDQPLLEAMHALATEQDRRSDKPHQRGYDPHRFEVAFARVSSGDLLALLYAEEPDFVAAWEALPEVEDYSYDGRSDTPDGADEAAYGQRCADWVEVMPGHAPPVLRTLSWKLRTEPRYDIGSMRLVSDRDEPEARTLLASQAPTLRARARAIVLDLIAAEITRRTPDADLLHALMPYLMRTPTHLIDAVAPLLHDDVVDYAIDGTGPVASVNALARARLRARGEEIPSSPEAPTRLLDLSGVEAAVFAHLDRPDEED